MQDKKFEIMPRPSKIVCVGRNYLAHIHELNNSLPDSIVLFLKPPSALTRQLHSEHHGEQLHYEAEACFGYKNGRLASLGFGLDLTKRSTQSGLKAKGLPWERAKAFDGSAVLSQFVEIDSISEHLHFSLEIDGIEVQKGDCQMMIHKPVEILKEIQTFMSLEDGDIIMTGTPQGVGSVQKNQKFRGRVFDGEKLLIDASWVAR